MPTKLAFSIVLTILPVPVPDFLDSSSFCLIRNQFNPETIKHISDLQVFIVRVTRIPSSSDAFMHFLQSPTLSVPKLSIKYFCSSVSFNGIPPNLCIFNVYLKLSTSLVLMYSHLKNGCIPKFSSLYPIFLTPILTQTKTHFSKSQFFTTHCIPDFTPTVYLKFSKGIPEKSPLCQIIEKEPQRLKKLVCIMLTHIY